MRPASVSEATDLTLDFPAGAAATRIGLAAIVSIQQLRQIGLVAKSRVGRIGRTGSCRQSESTASVQYHYAQFRSEEF